MSVDKNHSEQFERYLKGQMSPEEAHAFERDALDDPFAQEALEGYEAFGPDGIMDLKRLRNDISGKKQKSIPFIRIAAVVALLIIGSFTVYQFTDKIESEQLAMEEESLEEVLQNVPSPDTSTLRQQESIKVEKEIAQESKTENGTKDGLRVETKDDEIVQLALENEEESTNKSEIKSLPDVAETLRVEEELVLAETEIPEEIVVDEDDATLLQSKVAGVAVAKSDQIATIENESSENGDIEPTTNESTTARSKRTSGRKLNSASARSFSSPETTTIKGQVTDSEGEALPGVNVVIKGTTTGVTTGLDGSYSLPKTGEMTLVFSFVGFESQEVAVGTRNTIDITMGGATELQEVVITGVGKSSDSETFSPAKPIGGKKSYKQYLENNLRYPDPAKENGVEGTVILELEINTAGIIETISIKKSVGYGCDEEAIRLVEDGPKWNSARKGDAAVEDRVRVKVKFKLG